MCCDYRSMVCQRGQRSDRLLFAILKKCGGLRSRRFLVLSAPKEVTAPLSPLLCLALGDMSVALRNIGLVPVVLLLCYGTV